MDSIGGEGKIKSESNDILANLTYLNTRIKDLEYRLGSGDTSINEAELKALKQRRDNILAKAA